MSPRRRKPAIRPASRRRPAPAGDFWGNTAAVDGEVARIPPSDDATPLISSLGPPPLPSRETIAEHYFATVYDKAASLAIALAAQADLLAEDSDGLSGQTLD